MADEEDCSAHIVVVMVASLLLKNYLLRTLLHMQPIRLVGTIAEITLCYSRDSRTPQRYLRDDNTRIPYYSLNNSNLCNELQHVDQPNCIYILD